MDVYLSTPTIDDAESIMRIADDPDVAANIPTIPSPYKLDDAMRFIDFAVQRLVLWEDFHMCIRLPGGEVAGMCAIANFDKVNSKAELGYWVGKAYRGHGYAMDAARMMIGFGFGTLNLNRIYAKALMRNSQSIALLERMGLVREGMAREDIKQAGGFVDSCRFGILKRDYKEALQLTVER
jgi:[ribosomal protein S5]-alanine N-acetyltransferase